MYLGGDVVVKVSTAESRSIVTRSLAFDKVKKKPRIKSQMAWTETEQKPLPLRYDARFEHFLSVGRRIAIAILSKAPRQHFLIPCDSSSKPAAINRRYFLFCKRNSFFEDFSLATRVRDKQQSASENIQLNVAWTHLKWCEIIGLLVPEHVSKQQHEAPQVVFVKGP